MINVERYFTLSTSDNRGGSNRNAGAKPSCNCGQCQLCGDRVRKRYWESRRRIEERATVWRLRVLEKEGKFIIGG